MDASVTYPDHTYVHIVDEHGRLQRVFIRVHGYLVPIRIEGEVKHSVGDRTRAVMEF